MIHSEPKNVSFSKSESNFNQSIAPNMPILKEISSQSVVSKKSYSLVLDNKRDLEPFQQNKRSQSDANERTNEITQRKSTEPLKSSEISDGYKGIDEYDNLAAYSKPPTLKKRESVLQE